jgi:hypothetical protein
MKDIDPEHTEEILQRLRAGVRQRRAAASTLGPAGEESRNRLLALKAREYVQEPVPFSHRARLGRLIVLSRKLAYHLFLKWFSRPVLEQQNAFNHEAAGLIQALVEARERSERELRRLEARVAALEGEGGAAGGEGEGGGGGG